MSNGYQNTDDSITDPGAIGTRLRRYAAVFTNCIKALVQFLLWLIVGLAALAGAYASVRVILVAVRLILNAFGI